jgi:hypothetical protein
MQIILQIYRSSYNLIDNNVVEGGKVQGSEDQDIKVN